MPTVVVNSAEIHPHSVAQQVHRLIPNCMWAEVAPHSEAPRKYVRRVLEFLEQVEANA